MDGNTYLINSAEDLKLHKNELAKNKWQSVVVALPKSHVTVQRQESRTSFLFLYFTVSVGIHCEGVLFNESLLGSDRLMETPKENHHPIITVNASDFCLDMLIKL